MSTSGDHSFASTFKTFRDGTHRATSPTQTLDRMHPWLSEIGIARVANVTGLDTIGLPVVMVCRPNSRSVAVSQGKGLTLDAAKASGIMEATELWHAETALLPLRYASEEELGLEHSVVDTSALPQVVTAVYQRTSPILWTVGGDLESGSDVWLPYECVHMNSCVPLPAGSGFFLSTSNGLASGNCLIEAVVHGLCEVIERDSTALWHALPGDEMADRVLDLDTVDDVGCQASIELCRRARVAVIAWDTTSDIEVPTFACLIHAISDTGAARSAAVGYGCHNSRGVALFRAISEAAQSRLTFISGARDDIFRSEYEDNVRTRLALAHFRSMSTRPGRRFADVPSHDSPTFEQDLEWLLEQVHAAGFHHVVLTDLTREKMNIPAVRVVVPGLEGPDSDEQYKPGRRRAAAVASS